MKIKKIDAYEILDSRSNPTVEVKLILENGQEVRDSVPSGASTGSKEKLELRDEDEKRFGGQGVLMACDNIKNKIFSAIKEVDVKNQEEIDQIMLDLDGTENKSNLGANAILVVSLAVCRAAALEEHLSLWQYIQKKFNFENRENKHLPTPMVNVINGGRHADSGLDIQEFILVPSGVRGFFEKIRASSEIYGQLKKILKNNNQRIAVGDEGGFAPQLGRNEEALKLLNQAISEAGYKAGEEIMTGLDTAASEFYDQENKKYNLKLDNRILTSQELVEEYKAWVAKYNLEIIEDPLSEYDWEGWSDLNNLLGDKLTIIGDDLLVTNEKLIKKAIDEKACNSVLIKVNQIGSLTETIKAVKTAQQAGMKIAVSHRSGETTDDFIADLAVAINADYVKFGSVARGERVVKYNRILQIERENQ